VTRLLAPACALGILTVSVAHAQGDVRASRADIAVEVAAAGDPATTASMAERVRAVGSRLNVTTRWQDRARIDARDVLADKGVEAGVLARVWLDLSDPKRAVLYIANATHDRFLVRVVPASDGYGELTQESITTIVESVIDALIAGGQIGVNREEATRSIERDVGVPVEPAPPPVSPPLPEPSEPAPPHDRGSTSLSKPWSAVDLSYRMDAVSNGPSLRHGPQVSLSWTGFVSKSVDALVWFGGHYSASGTLGDQQEVAMHGGGARAAVGVTGRLTRVFAWQAAVGAGADAFGVQPRIAPESGLVAADAFSIVVPVATTFVGASLRLARWVSLPITVGLDVDLSSHHFDAELGAERATLVRPWVAHPFATVGVGVPFTE
jgi:hypothetical protein